METGARWSRVRPGRGTQAAALAAVLLAPVACVQERTLPESFVGPSELALSLQLTRGARCPAPRWGGPARSWSVLARNERARPVAQLPLTLQIVASDELQDFGTLSERSVTTGPDGPRPLLVYGAARVDESGRPIRPPAPPCRFG